MKNRNLFIVCYICLLLSLICGAAEIIAFREERVSESENRMLAGMPELNGESYFSGRFMDGFESYLSDAFFFREQAADITDGIIGVFDAGDDEETGEVAEELLFAPDDNDETGEPAKVPQKDEDNAPQESPVPTGAEKTDPGRLTDAEFYLIKSDGSRKIKKAYPADELAEFIDILNAYRAALPENGTLHFAVPPVSYIFHMISPTGEYTGWGSTVDDVMQPVVNDGIYIYDVADILTPYIGKERLYPISDHHWQPFSASLVAQTMIENQGLPPMDYYEYRHYLTDAENTKAYYGSELRNMKLSVEEVILFEPVSPVESYFLKQMNERSRGVFTDTSQSGLMYYLGGMHSGPWRLFETGFHTGRNALVIGDSFELTFTPFLAPYYDTILVTDLRDSLYDEYESGASIREYIEYYGIDDIYMLYSTYSPFCEDTTRNNLAEYLDWEREG